MHNSLKPDSIALVYVPALHAGVISYLTTAAPQRIGILAEDVLEHIDQEFDYLRKEIRALSPEQAEMSLRPLFPTTEITRITLPELKKLNTAEHRITLPAEDIFEWLATTHLSAAQITFGETFLRWNRTNTVVQNHPTAPLQAAYTVANKSSDWWRQVGCALLRDNTVISVAHNHHLPSPYTPYIDGDPRNAFHKGEHIDLSTAIHAEAALIANAARTGTPTQGAELYVTTFPCPACAKLVAESGITTLYYSEGYSVLDGETVLAAAGVKVVQLEFE